MSTTYAEAAIEADQEVPAIHIIRDFRATPAQLFRAHIDPEIAARWVGPATRGFEVDYWEAHDGGRWRYAAPVTDGSGERTEWFRGCWHTVREDLLVQTFTWEGMPDDVSLQTLTFEDLGDGRTRLHGTSLTPSFAARDGWLASGMEVGVNDGYAALQALVDEGAL